MRGHAVQRIKDVRLLRARQFPEDAGPLAHPVRPASYLKIDNFYTATIYEKGAELIGMLRDAGGRAGLPGRHGPLFRALRRPGGDGGGLRRLLRRSLRPRPVRTSSAGTRQAGTPEVTVEADLRRRDEGADADPRPVHRAHARPAGQAGPAHPDQARPAGRGRRALSFSLPGANAPVGRGDPGARRRRPLHRPDRRGAPAGALGPARLLRPGEARSPTSRRRTPTCGWPPTRTCSTAGRPARTWRAT